MFLRRGRAKIAEKLYEMKYAKNVDKNFLNIIHKPKLSLYDTFNKIHSNFTSWNCLLHVLKI